MVWWRHGTVRYGVVWYGVWNGMVWCGMVCYAMAWCGVVWHGTFDVANRSNGYGNYLETSYRRCNFYDQLTLRTFSPNCTPDTSDDLPDSCETSGGCFLFSQIVQWGAKRVILGGLLLAGISQALFGWAALAKLPFGYRSQHLTHRMHRKILTSTCRSSLLDGCAPANKGSLTRPAAAAPNCMPKELARLFRSRTTRHDYKAPN